MENLESRDTVGPSNATHDSIRTIAIDRSLRRSRPYGTHITKPEKNRAVPPALAATFWNPEQSHS